MSTVEELAIEAAAHWGGTPEFLISNRENAVFRMRLPEGVAALRLHRVGYQTEAAIRSELWFCGALADAGLAVPRVFTAQNGAELVTLGCGRIASALEWRPGVPLGKAGQALPGTGAEQAGLHHDLGRLMAQVHDATEVLSLPPEFERPAWDVDGMTGDTPFWGRFWEHPALSKAETSQLQEARGFLRAAMQDHAKTTPLLQIHADVLRENVLVNGGSIALIDFDDSGMGYPFYDLGTVMSQNFYEPAREEILAALLEGYQSLRPVDARMVDIFMLARTLASVGWTMPRRAADDPIMRDHIELALNCAEHVMV